MDNMKKSLKLEVKFDFTNDKCIISDLERNITDEYECCIIEKANTLSDFNRFIGDSVHAFLDDNNYDFYDYQDEEEDMSL